MNGPPTPARFASHTFTPHCRCDNTHWLMFQMVNTLEIAILCGSGIRHLLLLPLVFCLFSACSSPSDCSWVTAPKSGFSFSPAHSPCNFILGRGACRQLDYGWLYLNQFYLCVFNATSLSISMCAQALGSCLSA